MRAPLRVPVHYDFASSLCYVAHRVLGRVLPEIEALGIELVWTPLDLTRLSGWRRGAEMNADARENVLRVSRELDVPLVIPPSWMNSLGAMAVALGLERSPKEVAWRERVWSAVYEEGRSLDEPDLLERLARDLALDPPRIDGRRLDRVEVRTLEAIEARVTAVPTVMLDGWPLGGIQEDETMHSLFARYAARKREERASG